MRENGFYSVLMAGYDWEPAMWDAEAEKWFVIGGSQSLRDHHFLKIGPRITLSPTSDEVSEQEHADTLS